MAVIVRIRTVHSVVLAQVRFEAGSLVTGKQPAVVWQGSQPLLHSTLGMIVASNEPEQEEENQNSEYCEFDNEASACKPKVVKTVAIVNDNGVVVVVGWRVVVLTREQHLDKAARSRKDWREKTRRKKRKSGEVAEDN